MLVRRDGLTVDALALAIEDRAGVPRSQQRLVCGGRQLRPGQELSASSVGAASTVELLLRVEGGAKKDKGKKGKDKKGKDKGEKGKAPLGEGAEMSVEQLQEKIMYLNDSLDHEREERNYFQLERDKINTFWEISKKELEDRKAELRNKDREMEELEERHQVEIKVYKQKVKHLLYEHQNNVSQLKEEQERALKLQLEEHRLRESESKKDKRSLKLELKELGACSQQPQQPAVAATAASRSSRVPCHAVMRHLHTRTHTRTHGSTAARPPREPTRNCKHSTQGGVNGARCSLLPCFVVRPPLACCSLRRAGARGRCARPQAGERQECHQAAAAIRARGVWNIRAALWNPTHAPPSQRRPAPANLRPLCPPLFFPPLLPPLHPPLRRTPATLPPSSSRAPDAAHAPFPHPSSAPLCSVCACRRHRVCCCFPQVRELQSKYELKMKLLREDLELRRKVEILEIEERKNNHINELMKKHEKAFGEIKNYYNDITHNNLDLIRSLKEEVAEMKKKEIQNEKLMFEIAQENKKLSEPLTRALKEVEKLRHELANYQKDKMSLQNAKSRLHVLETQLRDLTWEHEVLEQRFHHVEKERDELYEKFESTIYDVQQKSGFKNILLERKLQAINESLEKKESQLSEVIHAANLDPNLLGTVSKKLDDVLDAKNGAIKDLQYELARVTKAHNDVIRVYESKLTEFGIPVEELGFRPLVTSTGTGPAGLVVS